MTDIKEGENERLRAACRLARPFVEACDWPAHDPMNDPPPFRVQRREALRAIDALLSPQTAPERAAADSGKPTDDASDKGPESGR